MGRCRTKCINETSFAHTEPAAKSGAGSPEHPGSVLWEKEKEKKKKKKKKLSTVNSHSLLVYFGTSLCLRAANTLTASVRCKPVTESTTEEVVMATQIGRVWLTTDTTK